MEQPDGSFKTEWDLRLDAIVNKLNSAPELQLFEVGPQGKLLGGDILLSKGPNDEFEAIVRNVKPGIWTITEKPRNDPMNFEGVLLRWVAPGPLDWDDLPSTLPDPGLVSLSEWKCVSGYSVDSGTHGLLDKDSLEELIESQEDNDREFILETLADYALTDDKLAVKVGFVIVGDDGGYSVLARACDGQKVEILVKPYETEDGSDCESDEGEDEDGGDE